MAYSSPTTERISVLFAGGYWARRLLPTGIGYVPVASRPRISLTSLEGVSIVTLVELCIMADYSMTAGWIPIPFVGVVGLDASDATV